MTLLPCPFCGGEARFRRKGTPRLSCVVVCVACGVRHESRDQDDRSGESWNRRPRAEALTATLVRCAELFDVALPRFNWATSPLTGEAIALLNEVPIETARVLRAEDR